MIDKTEMNFIQFLGMATFLIGAILATVRTLELVGRAYGLLAAFGVVMLVGAVAYVVGWWV